jgi:hypothetical protein
MMNCIQALQRLALQAHFWHWTGKSGYRHGVFAELYGYAHSAADKLVEPLMFLDRSPLGAQIEVTFPPVAQAVATLREVLGTVREAAGDCELSDPWLCNVLQEIERDLLNFGFQMEKLV